MRGVWAGVLAATLASAAWAEPPRDARGVFVTNNYALTFRAPPGLTYCRLPDGWVGSDHGTTLFLVPPRDCGGTGFPSSARGFDPDVPRVDVYYAYHFDEVEPQPCRNAGHMRLLGRVQPLCRDTRNGMAVREVRSRYAVSSPAELVVSLVTLPSRLRRDLRVLRAVAAGIRVCASTWHFDDNRVEVFGSGRPCPEHGDFY